MADIVIDLIEKQEVDSTNRLLLDMSRNGAPVGTTVWAHSQNTGRGRLGRSFSSPEGGIYISFLLPSPAVTELGFRFTAMAAIAVKRTIKTVCGKECAIKWVNDLVYNNGKVCGILAQGAGDKAVLGIGINYTTKPCDFPEELQDIATSLYGEGEEPADQRAFVDALACNVYRLCASTVDESAIAEYKCSSAVVGRKVQILQAGIVAGTGLVTMIDDNCHLHVVDESGKETVLSSGEVSIRIER